MDNRERYISRAYELGFGYERDFRGCAQSTIAAVQDTLGLRNDFIFKAASGLAGGCGLFGDGTCGAYTGGSMLLSSFFGRRRSRFDDDRDEKKCANLMIKQLRDRYLAEYGSIICSGVQTKIFGRSFDLWSRQDREDFEQAGAHTDKCTSVVGNASAWTMEILLQEIDRRGMTPDDFRHMVHVSSDMI
jgi:C_GCAxxG_C_C family probable redox protein